MKKLFLVITLCLGAFVVQAATEYGSVTVSKVISVYDGDTFRLQPWSYKWIVKKLKRNPELTIDDLNAMLQPTEKQLRRMDNIL